MEHRIKSDEPYFKAVWEKRKTFEIRKDDRGYNTGDTIVLLEHTVDDKGMKWPTRRKITAKIAYVTGFQQKDDYVVFGMKQLHNIDN